MNKIKKILWFVPPLLTLLIITNPFLHVVNVPPVLINTENTKILFPDTSNVETVEIAKHNLTLISVLHENMAMDATGSEARENIKSQNRLFYVAILAALASLLLINKTRSNPVRIFLLALIAFMYLLEIHREDLEKRNYVGFNLKGSAVESLVNSHSNRVWYIMKADSLNARLNEAHGILKRYPRKLLQACNSDLEQIVFYLFPWLGVYFLPKYRLREKILRHRLISGYPLIPNRKHLDVQNAKKEECKKRTSCGNEPAHPYTACTFPEFFRNKK